MRKTSRSTVEFSAAELRLLLRVLRLCEQVDQAIGHGPPDGMDAEQAEMALRGLLERRNVEPLPSASWRPW